MYTIKQAAARTGLTVPVLRAWERRYGIVTPSRTASGYRLYDDEAIARITAMRRLVDAGWSPSTAAAAIADGTAPSPTEPLPSSSELTAGDATLREAFIAAAGALDTRRLEGVLDEMLARGTFERVASEHVLPAVVAVGDAWQAGRIDVASEHLASQAVLRRFAAAYQAAGRPAGDTGAVIVGLPPGSRHALGALAFAVAARRAGLPVVYLGADLPIDDWVAAAERVAARAAVIGVVTPADRAPARRVAEALRGERPAIVVAFGGRHAPGAGSPGVEAADRGPAPIRLPDDLVDAVAALESALAAGSAPALIAGS
jgi:DNA-binding transcriptional MerR regulator/methylmalonyl-CoA mutase cobalamin-binding subunit